MVTDILCLVSLGVEPGEHGVERIDRRLDFVASVRHHLEVAEQQHPIHPGHTVHVEVVGD